MLKALTIAKNQCVGQRRPLRSTQVTIWSLAVHTLWVKMNYGAALVLLWFTHTKQSAHVLHGPGPPKARGWQVFNKCSAVHVLTWTGPWRDNKKIRPVLYLICSVQCIALLRETKYRHFPKAWMLQWCAVLLLLILDCDTNQCNKNNKYSEDGFSI